MSRRPDCSHHQTNNNASINQQKNREKMENNPNPHPQYLPEELWNMIKTHLNCRVDVFSFRAVCKSWRSLLPLSHLQSSLSPLHRLPLLSSSEHCYLLPFTICRLEPSDSNLACLTRAEESIDGQMQLLNPLTTTHLNNIKSDHPLPKSLNMLDFRLIQLNQFYCLKSPSGSPADGILKTLVVQNHDLDFEILCLLCRGRLGFWRSGCQEWAYIEQEESCYDDIIVYKKQFYGIDQTGIIWWMNCKTLEMIMYSPPIYLGGQKTNLVESEGDLYVVDRYLTEANSVYRMRVFKLDEEWGEWVDVASLGDRLFVIGNDCCFSASAVDLACSNAGNSVFFTPSYRNEGFSRKMSGDDAGVCRLDDSRVRLAAYSYQFPTIFDPSHLIQSGRLSS